jgi:hypothetical protein
MSTAVRQEKGKPLVLELRRWLEQQLVRVSGKSLIPRCHPLRLKPLEWTHPFP